MVSLLKKRFQMKTKIFIICLFSILLAACARENHFISAENERKEIEQAFEYKKTLFQDTALFDVFNQSMSLHEKEAMKFLYAYMPIGDIADYTGTFYLENVRASFKTQQEMPWGKQIPEIIFRHFVLPIRVNNENLDESRMLFYQELKDRVKDLSLHDAVLEVNHWCHEKVVYTPSDSRTSSPLASVKTAHGRCGEESTFTVAALRAVGIPARQVYTPRWAHTDDNHAWVEAWVDGKWFFLGACEPEPVLNLGWFNAPASRGMLMHTKVFGRYNGPEEVMDTTRCYTEINVIENYAPKAQAIVIVVDKNNQPIPGATVEFKLYNYAEFYTVATKKTNSEGQCALSAGKGEILVWATSKGMFGCGKIAFGKDENLTISVDKNPSDSFAIDLDMTPPAEGKLAVNVTEQQKETNAKRLLQEDSIRNLYVATFITDEKARSLAKKQALDEQKVSELLLKSRGNWEEISKYLQNIPNEKQNEGLVLLQTISDKDLRDTPATTLLDHLNNTPVIPQVLLNKTNPQFANELFEQYVLNPRVLNELLTPYKNVLAKVIDPTTAIDAKSNPQMLAHWVNQNIHIHNQLNPQTIPVMPTGVAKARIADTHSRNIFFVALARSLGIPARIERVTGKVQYFNSEWTDVDFETPQQATTQQGSLAATYTPIQTIDNPKYYSHFTVAKIKPDGTLQTLRFERKGAADMGLGGTWAGILKTPQPLDEGNYLLVTGTRMASGKVLARIASFNIQPSQQTTIPLVMRESKNDLQVIGNIDAEALFQTTDNQAETSILNTSGRGYYIIGILGPKQEPTNHALRDISLYKKEFETWNRSIILLFKDDQAAKLYDKSEFGQLPTTITYGIDTNSRIAHMVTKAMNLSNAETLPIFVIADTFGRVVFVSQGYTIGLGEQMIQTIHKLSN